MNFVFVLIVGLLVLFCPSFLTSHSPSTFKGSRVWFHHSGVGRGVQVSSDRKSISLSSFIKEVLDTTEIKAQPRFV